MSKVHYFQRYSQRENIATNNTLLLLSRLYAHEPSYLEAFLNDLVETGTLEVGPTFIQQATHEGASVPDAVIAQKSFKLVVEAKHHTQPAVEQLGEHLKSFGDEETQVIMLLTRAEQTETFKERLGAEVKSFNLSRSKGVVDICTTFEKLIGSFGDTLADHDYEMRELLEDYEAFCFEENLLPREDRWMRAVPCGKTLEDNLALGLYYQPVGRASREHRYLGVYKNKKVQGIGEIDNVVVADLSEDGLEIHDRSDREKPVSQQQRERIEKAIHNAREQHGYNIATGHKFFLVDEFHRTDFRKTSSGGLMAQRYFDLSNMLETSRLPAVQEIANILREKTW